MPTTSQKLSEKVITWKAQLSKTKQDLADLQRDQTPDLPGHEEFVQGYKITQTKEKIAGLVASIAMAEKNGCIPLDKSAQPLAPIDDELLCELIKAERVVEAPPSKDPSPLIEASTESKQ